MHATTHAQDEDAIICPAGHQKWEGKVPVLRHYRGHLGHAQCLQYHLLALLQPLRGASDGVLLWLAELARPAYALAADTTRGHAEAAVVLPRLVVCHAAAAVSP